MKGTAKKNDSPLFVVEKPPSVVGRPPFTVGIPLFVVERLYISKNKL